MMKLDFLSEFLCCCDIIFDIKYPRAESEDLDSYPLPLVRNIFTSDVVREVSNYFKKPFEANACFAVDLKQTQRERANKGRNVKERKRNI